MASVDEINTVNPTWRIDRKKDENTKDGKHKTPRQKTTRSKKNPKPDDGRPHIDEYA